MRAIGMLGLSAAAALAVAAFAGTGLASATVLCKANESPECLTAKQYKFGEIIKLEAKFEVVFKEGEFVQKCKKSALEFKIFAGTPLPIEVKNLTFTECSGGCTVTARNLPYEGDITATEKGWGILRLLQKEGANPSIKVTCFGSSCIYGEEKIENTILPGEPASLLTSSEPLLWEQGPSCATELIWSGSYKFVQSPLFVVAEP
jgi:hypothetical protein